MTGSVSGRFAAQQWLQAVVLSNNSLAGPIDDVFAASSASELILNNQFSGTLPVASLRSGRVLADSDQQLQHCGRHVLLDHV